MDQIPAVRLSVCDALQATSYLVFPRMYHDGVDPYVPYSDLQELFDTCLRPALLPFLPADERLQDPSGGYPRIHSLSTYHDRQAEFAQPCILQADQLPAFATSLFAHLADGPSRFRDAFMFHEINLTARPDTIHFNSDEEARGNTFHSIVSDLDPVIATSREWFAIIHISALQPGHCVFWARAMHSELLCNVLGVSLARVERHYPPHRRPDISSLNLLSYAELHACPKVLAPHIAHLHATTQLDIGRDFTIFDSCHLLPSDISDLVGRLDDYISQELSLASPPHPDIPSTLSLTVRLTHARQQFISDIDMANCLLSISSSVWRLVPPSSP